MPGVPVPDGGGRGGGGGGGVDPVLLISPNSPLNLGAISSAAPTDFTVSLRNPGASQALVHLTSINFSDPQFSVVTALPLSVGSTAVVLTLRVTPTSLGALTCNLTFNNDGSISQVHYTVNATSIDPSTQGIPKIVMQDPSLPVGQMPTTKQNTSNTTGVGVKNVGVAAFNITAAAIITGGAWFALNPTVTLPVNLATNGVQFFPVKFTPDDVGVFVGTLRFTTDLLAPLNHVDVALSGLSVPFFPVSVLDNANRAIMFAFQGGTLKYIDTNVYDYDDDDSVIEFNGSLWEAVGQEKTIERLEVFYENIGVCTSLIFTLSVLRPSMGSDQFDVVTKTIQIGTASADNTDRSTFVDLTASGELIFLKVTRTRSSGPCALTAIIPHFADRGEKVESV